MKFFTNFNHAFNQTAIIEKNGTQLTYQDLDLKMDEFSHFFLPGKKNLILLLGSNQIQSVTAYLSVLKHNHAMILIHQDSPVELIQKIISNFHPDLIMQPKDRKIPDSYEFYQEIENYTLSKKDFTRDFPIHEELNLLLSTSGTTGHPKLVRLSRENLNFNASSIVHFLNLTQSDRCITVLPITFIFGLSILNTHLLSRSVILLTDDSIMKKSFWDFFTQFQPTSLSGVPYTFEILSKQNFIHLDIGKLRLLTLSGGRLKNEILDQWIQFSKEKNVQFFNMYGQSEAGGRISYLPPELLVFKKGSVGIPIPGSKISIDHNNDPRGIGEILFSCKSVMLGYAEKEEDLSKGPSCQDFLRTGDIGKIDHDGCIYIIGRKRNCIQIQGKKLYVDEIENSLQTKGLDCVCIGQDNLLRIAYTNDQETLSIKKELSHRYQLNSTHYQIFKVPEIIRNSNGKIQYAKIF